MEITNEPKYLGDGVYIYSDGYHLILEANPMKIYLDSQTRRTLFEILKQELEHAQVGGEGR